MTFRLIVLAAALGLTAAAHAAPPAPQAVTPAKGMNYDCTKAGNKNKAACKNVTPAAVATTATPPAKVGPTPTPVKASGPSKPMNYDCTKAGNANKAACKNVVVPPAPTAAPAAAARPMAAPAARPAAAKAPVALKPGTVAATLKNGKVVHYDCTKAGNADKTACKK